MYALYAMLRRTIDNYENIVQRFHAFWWGGGGFFRGFRITHGTKYTGKNVLWRDRDWDRDGNNRRQQLSKTHSAGRSTRDPWQPQHRHRLLFSFSFWFWFALSRIVSHECALNYSLSQNRARVVRATSGSAHAQCSRCSCCSSCLHSWLSLSQVICLCRGNFAPTRISNCALFMFLMDVSRSLCCLRQWFTCIKSYTLIETCVYVWEGVNREWNLNKEEASLQELSISER